MIVTEWKLAFPAGISVLTRLRASRAASKQTLRNIATSVSGSDASPPPQNPVASLETRTETSLLTPEEKSGTATGFTDWAWPHAI